MNSISQFVDDVQVRRTWPLYVSLAPLRLGPYYQQVVWWPQHWVQYGRLELEGFGFRGWFSSTLAYASLIDLVVEPLSSNHFRYAEFEISGTIQPTLHSQPNQLQADNVRHMVFFIAYNTDLRSGAKGLIIHTFITSRTWSKMNRKRSRIMSID